MTDERIWQLIILKFTGEATPAQLAELEQVLKQYPQVGFQLGILEEVWKNKQKRESLDIDAHFNRHLQRLSNQLSEEEPSFDHQASVYDMAPGKRSFVKRAWLIGTAAVTLFIIGLLVFNNKQPGPKPAVPTVQNLVSTKNGSKTKLQLPDGSEVWLNAGSKISYGNDFTGPQREVSLDGEAFFEVVKDSSRPFIIHTHAVDVKVLGTAFNLRSYPDERMTETALIRGSVEVTLHANPGKKIVLKPNEKLIVKNDSSISTNDTAAAGHHIQLPLMTLTQVHYLNHGRDSATSETMWTKNKLVFDGETLQEVAVKLERWYGVRVTIQGDHIRNVAYNAIFEDENIDEVLYALQLTGNFHYTIKKKEVTIRP